MEKSEVLAVDEEPLEFIKDILSKDCELIKVSGGIDAFLGTEENLPDIILKIKSRLSYFF